MSCRRILLSVFLRRGGRTGRPVLRLPRPCRLHLAVRLRRLLVLTFRTRILRRPMAILGVSVVPGRRRKRLSLRRALFRWRFLFLRRSLGIVVVRGRFRLVVPWWWFVRPTRGIVLLFGRPLRVFLLLVRLLACRGVRPLLLLRCTIILTRFRLFRRRITR